MTPGQRLREAREARHMTIGDIARRTYIQVRFLQAIDDDNLSVLPDSHRRLFIREYARLVGVDPEELYPLLPDVPSSTGSSAGEASSVPSSTEAIPVSAPLPHVRTVAVEERGMVDEEDRKTNRALLRRLSAGKGVKLVSGGASGWLLRGATLLLLVVAGYFIVRGVTGKGKPDHDESMAVTDEDTAQTQVLPRADSDTATMAEEGDSLTLEGRSTGRVWFALVADGKKSEQGTMDSGEVKTWRAAEEFRISLSNAGGLQLLLNGKSLGALGPLRTSVRNQVITSKGLQLRGPAARRAEPATTQGTAARRPTTTPPRATTPSRTTPPRATTPSRTTRPTTTRTRRPPRQTPVLTPAEPRGPVSPP